MRKEKFSGLSKAAQKVAQRCGIAVGSPDEIMAHTKLKPKPVKRKPSPPKGLNGPIIPKVK